MLSPEGQDAHDRVAESYRQRYRHFSWVFVGLSCVLALSTLLPWASRLHVVSRSSRSGLTHLAIVPTRTLGIVTLPAGPLLVAVALWSAFWSARVARESLTATWLTLVGALGAVAVASTEMIQLLLGRRNWISHHPRGLHPGPWGRAVGPGVWVALPATLLFAILTILCLELLYGDRRARSGELIFPV